MPPVGAVYRNPGRWRAVIHQQEIRHSTAGCLLSVVLLAPLFVRCYGVAPVAGVTLLYSVVVVPTLAGYYSLPGLVARTCRLLQHSRSHGAANSWYSAAAALRGSWGLLHSLVSVILLPVVWLQQLVHALVGELLPALVRVVGCVAAAALHLLHSAGCITRHTAVLTTAKQLSYLLLLECALLPDVRLMALYHLLFFNILLYITKGYAGGRPGVHRPLTVAPSYASSTGWFMAARLAKATVVSTLLSAAAHQHLHLSGLYSGTGGLYLALTQHTWAGEDQLVQWLARLHASSVEEEGYHFLIPCVLNSLPIVMAVTTLGPHLHLTLLSVIIPAVTLTMHGQPHSEQSVFPTSSSTELEPKDCPSSSILNSGSSSSVSASVTSSAAVWTGPAAAWTEPAAAPPNIASLGPWLLLAGAALALNVLLPTIQLWKEYWLYQQQPAAMILRLKRATNQDCARQETCAVCLETLLCGRVTNCGHVYHSHCLRSLLTTHHTRCPLCNRNI